MDYIERWVENLFSRSPAKLNKNAIAWGECRRHTGPSMWFARVRISIGPNETLAVEHKLTSQKYERLFTEGWLDEVIYGVMDIMFTHTPAPYRSFQLTVVDAEYDDIESRRVAFRLAARDATIKALKMIADNAP